MFDVNYDPRPESSQMTTSSTAPLQSPSIHWKKRLSYDYIPPATMSTHDHRLEHTVGHGAPTQVARGDPSVHFRPQTSVTCLLACLQ